jgi:chromosomal replication initiation ATPase DnaA
MNNQGNVFGLTMINDGMVSMPVGEYNKLKSRAELADVMLADKPNRRRPVMADSDLFDFICDYICAAYFVPREVVMIRCRKINVVLARQLIMYLCVKFGLTTVYIGERMGLDHSSVVWGNKKVKSDMEVYNDFSAEVNKLVIEVWERACKSEVIADLKNINS